MLSPYRREVLALLEPHGLLPRPWTPPGAVYGLLEALYRYELRRLRARLLRGELPKTAYAGEVERVRARYPLLSVPPDEWLREPAPRDRAGWPACGGRRDRPGPSAGQGARR